MLQYSLVDFVCFSIDQILAAGFVDRTAFVGLVAQSSLSLSSMSLLESPPERTLAVVGLSSMSLLESPAASPSARLPFPIAFAAPEAPLFTSVFRELLAFLAAVATAASPSGLCLVTSGADAGLLVPSSRSLGITGEAALPMPRFLFCCSIRSSSCSILCFLPNSLRRCALGIDSSCCCRSVSSECRERSVSPPRGV